MPDVFDQIELDKPKDLFDEVGEAWKAEPLGPPEPPQYQPETAAPIPALVPVPPMPAPVPDGQFPLRFIPPVPLSPEQATARRMAAPSTLLPSIPEKYGAGVAQGFPFVQEFGPKVQETDPALLAAGKALVNVGLSLPEFATSPLGALTAAAGPIAPRVTSAAFSIDMLGGVLKQFPEVYAKWNTLSTARQVETGINLAAAIIMGGFLGKKAVTGWGKQPLGRSNLTQQQAVQFAAELAERDPETFGQLAKEQVQKAVDVEQRAKPPVPIPPPVIQPKREEAVPIPPVPEPPIRDITAPTTEAAEAMRAGVAERLEAGKSAPGTAAAEASARAQAAVEAGAARVEAAPAPPAGKALSTVQISKAWKGIQSKLDRSDLESLLAEWFDVELSEDGTRMFWIDQRAGGGRVPMTKGDFLKWLRSDEATAVSADADWQVLVGKAREAAGLPVVKKALTAPAAGETVKGVKTTVRLTENDATEVLHKLDIVSNEPDLLADYGLTKQQADALVASIPRNGGEWDVPAWAHEAVLGEMEDHVQVLRDIAADARSSNERGQALRIDKQATRLERLFDREKFKKPAAPAAQPEVPSFAARFDPETLMQRPAWVEPGSMLDKVLDELREKNDPAIVRDIAPIWKTLTPAQRQDLAARGWVTTTTRDPKVVALKLAQDVPPARLYYGRQAKQAIEKGIQYAPEERKVEEGREPEHPGTEAQRLPTAPSGGYRPEPSTTEPKAPEVLLTPPAAEAAKPPAPSTKAGEAGPVFTKAKQAAIDSATKAADFLIEIGDKYSSATMPQRLKKQNESAMIRMRSAAAKLGIEVPSSGTWFMPQENAKVAREVKAKLAALQGQPPPTPGAAAGGPISPGPGAAAAGTPGTGSAIRELADYVAALPPLPAPRKLSLAEKWAERLGSGKDLGTRIALRASAITESIKDSMRGVRRPTELGDSVAQLDFLLQKSAGESLRTRTVLEKAIRNPDVRAALWLFADAKGDLRAIRDTLATMPADTKPAVRRALQIALRLPPEARNWLPFVEQFYGRKFAEAEAEGVLHEALPDYFTHVWKVKEDMPGSVQAALNSGKISEYFRYARERKLSTMLEGIKNPRMIPGMRLEPVLDAAKIIGHYNYALDRAIASRRFMERLSEMNASDGRPLVAPSGRAIPSEELKWAVINDTTGRADPFVKGIFDTPAEANAELARRGAGYHVEQRKNEFLMIKSRIRPEEIADYRPIDHPAMRKWQWAGTDATGKTTLYEGELLAHPEAYERLSRFMDRSRLTPGKLTGGLLRYSGEVKAAKLGLLSTFHQVHVAKHALFHWTSPFRAPEIDWDAPEVRFAIEKGHLKLAPEPGELNNFAEGILADEAIIHKLPIVGELSRRYSHYLFTDYIPRLKMATFANALERNRAIYGQTRGIGGAIKAFGAKPLSDAEIAARVGDSVNAAFGELNKLWLGKQGRDPRFQRALRMIFLAPDFGEARLRFVGKAFTKYGAEERFALAMNFATIYGLARLANWLASGDPHADDPKHWFDVKLGDHWYSMRSVMTDIAHLLAKPERFTRVRLNPGITEPLLEFISSRDWLGHTRTKGQQVEDYAKKFIPIAAQSLAEDDRHMWESFLGSMGIQPKRGDAVTEVHERAASYKEARGIQEPVEVQQAPSGNPYREGRIALEFNDPRRFWQAMQQQYAQLKARNNPDPMGTIQAAFDRYYSKPFMGSERLEKDFVAQMNPRDRKLYAEARQEQQLSAKKFHAWWDKWHDYMLTGHRTGI